MKSKLIKYLIHYPTVKIQYVRVSVCVCLLRMNTTRRKIPR